MKVKIHKSTQNSAATGFVTTLATNERTIKTALGSKTTRDYLFFKGDEQLTVGEEIELDEKEWAIVEFTDEATGQVSKWLTPKE